MVVTILVDSRDSEKKWQRNEQAIKVQLKASSREFQERDNTAVFNKKLDTYESPYFSFIPRIVRSIRPIDGSFVKRRNPIHDQIKSLQFQRV